MSKRKASKSTSSTRAQLSKDLLDATLTVFAESGIDVIRELAKSRPEKYAELLARLVATIEPQQEEGPPQNMEEWARQSLIRYGAKEETITQDIVTRTIAAHDVFYATLSDLVAEIDDEPAEPQLSGMLRRRKVING